MTDKEKREFLSRNAVAILNWVEQNIPFNMNADIKYNFGFIYHHNVDYIMIRIKDGKASIIEHHATGREMGISSDGTITEYDDYIYHRDENVTDKWLTNFNWGGLHNFADALEYTCEHWRDIKQKVLYEIEKERKLVNFTV